MRLDPTKPRKAKSSDVSLCSKTAATKIIRLVLQPRLIKLEHTHSWFLTMSITTMTWKKQDQEQSCKMTFLSRFLCIHRLLNSLCFKKNIHPLNKKSKMMLVKHWFMFTYSMGFLGRSAHHSQPADTPPPPPRRFLQTWHEMSSSRLKSCVWPSTTSSSLRTSSFRL